jgi:hypothetical protein
MDGFDSKLCLREFWECLDTNQRENLLKVNIKDDDEEVQCEACRPCYKAAVVALKEKANETRFEGHANDSDRQTIWVTKLCAFLGVYSGPDAWEGHVVPSKFDTAAANNGDDWNDTSNGASSSGGGIICNSNNSSATGVSGDVEKFLRICNSTTEENKFLLTSPLANDLVEHICVLFDPNDKGRSSGHNNHGNQGKKGKKGGKKGKKGGKKGKGNKGKNTNHKQVQHHQVVLKRSNLMSIFDTTTGGNPVLNDRGKPSKQCWYCQDKISLRFLDLLTYPRPVRKFKLLLDPAMTLKDLKILVRVPFRRSGLPVLCPSVWLTFLFLLFFFFFLFQFLL